MENLSDASTVPIEKSAFSKEFFNKNEVIRVLQFF
jgi:hypothetical protein